MWGGAKEVFISVSVICDLKVEFVFLVIMVRWRKSLRKFIVCGILFIRMLQRHIVIRGSIMGSKDEERALLGMSRCLIVSGSSMSSKDWVVCFGRWLYPHGSGSVSLVCAFHW